MGAAIGRRRMVRLYRAAVYAADPGDADPALNADLVSASMHRLGAVGDRAGRALPAADRVARRAPGCWRVAAGASLRRTPGISPRCETCWSILGCTRHCMLPMEGCA